MTDVDRNKIFVFDLETDNLNKSNRAFSASPYYKDNEVVNSGWAVVEVNPDTGDAFKKLGVCGVSRDTQPDDTERGTTIGYYPWLLCGHNVRYDIQFLRKCKTEDPLVTAVKSGDTTLWDTQFAEYLLSGHKDKMISLNKLAEKYGFEAKFDEVKEMWDSGYKTRDIDGEMLDNYVEQDVKITTDIALRQIALAYEYGMLDFILVQMRSLFVVSEYEWNGMYVAKAGIWNLEDKARKNANTARHWAFRHCTEYLEEVDLCNELMLNHTELNGSTAVAVIDEWFDIESVDKLKRLFFGGEFKIKYPVEIGTYKTGKKKGEPKYQNREFTYPLPAVIDPDTMPDAYLTPTGIKSRQAGKELTFKDVSLDDSTIEYLGCSGVGNLNLNRLLGHIQGYRDNKKLETTYCKAVRDYLFEDDGLLHGNLNVDNSATGRLTSSNPNMQNMPSKDDSEFKDVFVSRFENGRIGAVDFKQLEVVALAYLSGDEQLIDDLKNGRDIHTETGREAGLVDASGSMSHDVRRNIKGINFGTIYGAGVTKLTQQSGLGEVHVKRCIDALKKRYPKAFGRQYIHDISEALDLYAERLDRDDSGKRRYGNYIYQPTGRRIWLETAPSKTYPTGELEQEWPYTKMRNYPVQSLAADIVSVARILFYDVIQERMLQDKLLMINEVHDEIVFDLDNVATSEFQRVVDLVQERLLGELEYRFNLDKPFDLPLVLETGVGKTWREAK